VSGLRNHTPRFAAQHAYFLNDSAFQETVLQLERNPRYRFVLNRIEGPEWSRMPVVLQINVALWGNAHLFGCPGSKLASGCVLGNHAFNQQNRCPAMPLEMAVVSALRRSAEELCSNSQPPGFAIRV
jgi:hypothetical protein